MDFYVQQGQSYIRPLKVWDRYSPTMSETHMLLSPMGMTPEGPWNRIELVQKMAGTQAPPKSDYMQSMETLLLRLKDHTCWSEANCEALRLELIRTLVTQTSEYFKRARKYFSLDDIEKIYNRLVGSGKIGGKAAGMLLARKILDQAADTDMPELKSVLLEHDSFYIGSDIFFQFLLDNDLLYLLGLQYKDRDAIVAEYPTIRKKFLEAPFRPNIVEQMKKVLEHFGTQPIIVRSSSLLEDNFGNAFAGKYESVFLTNQGTFEERLEAFLTAIKTVYSSVLRPDALLYRIKHNLINSDEQMAILVMRVEGRNIGNILMPVIAGVGFSRNYHPWSPRLDTNKGLLRIVFGMGTRAVDRVGNDYPRMIALSNPKIRPVLYESEIRRYSQHNVDLIDFSTNEFKSREVNDFIAEIELPVYRYIFSILHEGTFTDPITMIQYRQARQKILTFNNLINKTPFTKLMDKILQRLEEAYGIPVDIEFIADIDEDGNIKINLLQCRPLSEVRDQVDVEYPENIDECDIIFRTDNCVNTALIDEIKYIVYVDIDGYNNLDRDKKYQVGRAIGRINSAIEAENEKYILVGPGRWGSSNIDLGVNVSYADIDASSVIVEVAKTSGGYVPEVSYGTHFFQDLVEDKIYYLAVYPGINDNILNEGYLRDSHNHLNRIAPQYQELSNIVHIVKMDADKGNFEVIIDRKSNRAACIIKHTG